MPTSREESGSGFLRVALEAISIAATDGLIRRAMIVRKRFTGLGEAEDYQAAAAAFERSVPPIARKPAAKEEGAEILEAA
jgi:hypothetical protein